MRRPLLLLFLVVGCSSNTGSPRPNVLLITLESLRTDHVKFQDGTLPTTPVLDALAREGVVYEDAHSVTSWTLASHASLFTGLYPRAHATIGPTDALGESYPTLAGALRDEGYQTAGVSSGPYLRTAHGLHRGFEHYDDSLSSPTHVKAHSDRTNPGMLERMLRFLDEERDPTRPFLLFGYFWDPHYDYVPPPPWNKRFVGPECTPFDLQAYEQENRLKLDSPPGMLAYTLSQYNGEIAWTDETLGALFKALRERGLWEDTLVIVTSDHGEEFFEHGSKGHKNNLHAESVHVPLVVKYPHSRKTGRDKRLVSLVDIFPTVLQVVGASLATPLHGRSLLEAKPAADRSIFYELLSIWYVQDSEGNVRTQSKQWLGVRKGRFKLLEVNPDGKRMLYDIRADPGETKNLLLAPRHPPAAQNLRKALRSWSEEMDLSRELFDSDGEADLSEEELERLKALGYL